MSVDIVVPPLGESVTEATIAKWHKNPGDIVAIDEIVVELETDKVTLEVSSLGNGVLSSVVFKEGDLVNVGDVLGVVSETSGVVNKKVSEEKPQTSAPSARKIAAEKGIDISSVQGSGRDGMVMKQDLNNVIDTYPTQPNNKPVVEFQNKSNEVREERVRMTKLRKTIAQRLKYSQNTAAILSTFNEVDMSEIFRIRKAYQEHFTAKHGVKLGFMSFFTKAVVNALKNIPSVNAQIEEDDIIYKNYYDIGVAVGTDAGLVVPVLRDADKKSFAEIESNIVELSVKAKQGKLSMSDMTGATFTITNGGTYGSLLSTPIINPPQSGILGMHNIVERPVAISGQVVIRPMMYIALSYDHRIIDGKEAVTFLVNVKQLIENPEKLLFDL